MRLSFLKINRISGDDREKTALAVADKFFPSTETSILASGYTFADALVGGYIGAKMNAPILLTNTNLISAETERASSVASSFARVPGTFADYKQAQSQAPLLGYQVP